MPSILVIIIRLYRSCLSWLYGSRIVYIFGHRSLYLQHLSYNSSWYAHERWMYYVQYNRRHAAVAYSGGLYFAGMAYFNSVVAPPKKRGLINSLVMSMANLGMYPRIDSYSYLLLRGYLWTSTSGSTIRHGPTPSSLPLLHECRCISYGQYRL